MTTFKNTTEKAIELINNNDVKSIFIHLKTIDFYNEITHQKEEFNKGTELGDLFISLIKVNSQDFTKDIAIKCLDNKNSLSEKQSWCCAYQIKNNAQVYILAIKEYVKKGEF